MSGLGDSRQLFGDKAPQFTTTHWSVVIHAGQPGSAEAAAALETLCRAYWYPLYAWLRVHGHSPPDAQDLTQGFFAHLLERNTLGRVDREKGRFRSFLLASLRNYLSHERDKKQAWKRGGSCKFISIDEEAGERRFKGEPADHATPDRAFEQSWAATLIDLVLEQLRREYTVAGKADFFQSIQGYLSGDRDGAPYLETAARLNLTEGSLKMAVLRMRRRYAELLRVEIAHTVNHPAEIDQELRALFAAVSR